MFTLYGFFGVGWAIRRGWRDTLQRLGLTRLTPAGLSIAIAAWLGLFLMDIFVSLIWRTVAPDAYKEFGSLTESLFGSFISIPGALTIGLSAGIGEEILFRGALQPRLGIPVTAFLFMIVHAQYGFTPALLQILVVGVVLGLIRRYTNTTACVVVHTLFNTVSVLMALWFPDWI
jgi:membrane protease YdiL (CAAX protease family)